MEVVYTSSAKEDYSHWKKVDLLKVKRIESLIADIKMHPFSGIGKPEPLRFEKKGYWSRRIDQEHRLVYRVVDSVIYIAQCRYHY